MYCLSNMCYVCLKQKDSLLTNLNSSLSANSDVLHIIEELPFDLAWLTTMQTTLVCEECCSRLRETYRLRAMCLKNSALLRDYVHSLNTGTETEKELTVSMDSNEVQSTSNTGHTAEDQVHSEEEAITTLRWRPNLAELDKEFVDFEDALLKAGIICKNHVDDKQDQLAAGTTEESGDVFVNVEDYFVKEEDSWKREPADDAEEWPVDNSSVGIAAATEDVTVNLEDYFVKEEDSWKQEPADDTEERPIDNSSANNQDRESDSEISVNSYGPASHTDSDSSECILRKPFECSICSESFVAKSVLITHMRIHTGEKPYKCSECDKCFRQRSTLVTHMRIHTGEKPHKCSECDKCFSHRSNLVAHMRIHTGEKSYKCSECDKCFSDRSQLRRHMRIHSGEKPFKCSECDKCFSRRPGLVAHMRTHTGEKPYKCSECDKYFSRRPTLVSHMRIHTGEKPFVCSRCKKCFRERSNLATHMRVHTRE